MPERGDLTDVLLRAAAGSSADADRLFPLVYEELRAIAGSLLRRERPDHTLQATELVHEAYRRLVDSSRCEWNGRAHFFAVAGRAMRRVLVDHARRRGAGKRGGRWQKVPLERALEVGAEDADEITLALGEALERLEAVQPEKARVVEMRFYAGLNEEECAAVLGVSRRTVARHWEYARAWLYRELTDSQPPSGERA
ncbi:MAG: ECF-type sigma factor [bacterium]